MDENELSQNEPHDIDLGNDDLDVARTRRRRAPIALATAALLLCTAGGGVGGLVLSNYVHDSSTNNNPNNAGGGYFSQRIPGYGYFNYGPQGFPEGGGSNQSPNSNGGSQQTSGTETTSPATSPQLVGLVRIQTTLGYANGAATGSGMILTSNGEVITNHHVVEGATSIVVTVMSTGQRYQATLVGSDAKDDIAVLQLNGASGLTPIHTNTGGVRVGQSIVAVGDARGATTFTASPGAVTATNQTISPSDNTTTQSETLTGIIAYAADVVPGDSGGATYDSSGAVVGMTTAASEGGAETDGYAIPIAKVLSVAADLENHVASSSYAYGLPSFIGVGVNQGAVVEQVYSGTGAASSGLAAGDRIVAVDGTAVSSADQLQVATRSHAAGSRITLTWVTPEGQRQSATIVLMSGPVA